MKVQCKECSTCTDVFEEDYQDGQEQKIDCPLCGEPIYFNFSSANDKKDSDDNHGGGKTSTETESPKINEEDTVDKLAEAEAKLAEMQAKIKAAEEKARLAEEKVAEQKAKAEAEKRAKAEKDKKKKLKKKDEGNMISYLIIVVLGLVIGVILALI